MQNQGILLLKGMKIPDWKALNGTAPLSAFWAAYDNPKIRNYKKEDIALIPYGSTTFRITEFPMYNF